MRYIPIHFDNKSGVMGIDIRDKRTNRVLSSEFNTAFTS